MDYYERNIDRRMSGEKKSFRITFSQKLRSLAKQVNDMKHWVDDNKVFSDADIKDEMEGVIMFLSQLEKSALKIERPTTEELSRNIKL
jgi:hypothetical protein